ncbi:protein GET1 [Sitophilus oryzae]|uniref:Guided entry of tail-anchored proteins factor 1 n=1 Tax=Sitophilus oryzae TaxID=7048 RepID=A0A6J2YEU6_SITOR|nr:protein GET1 [Sitophilus oryzae]
MVYLLIISTALSFLSAHPSTISNKFLKWNSKATKEERELLQQRSVLIADQRQHSMVDQFAKYSKLQRRINAIDEKLKEQKDQKNSPTVLYFLLSKYGIQMICGFCLLMLTLYYRRTTLFVLDDNIDLSPFNYLISFPNEKNCVSFHFWVMTCNVVARLIK